MHNCRFPWQCAVALTVRIDNDADVDVDGDDDAINTAEIIENRNCCK